MTWFSERHGYRSVRDTFQIEELEPETRRRVWNLLSQHIYFSARGEGYRNFNVTCQRICRALWHNYFKWTYDHLNSRGRDGVYDILRTRVMDEAWFIVYDFIEATIEYTGTGTMISNFITECNEVLEEDLCGYRIISGNISPITSSTEIAEIEEALSHPCDTINQHIETALDLLSDRVSPNFPNSVKEAISAVECACRIILVDRNVTLGDALKRLSEVGVPAHGAFTRGISALYGWTSSDAGIRHARVDDSEIGFDEAKMMIVLCSAFVNFLISKAEKAGIDLVANFSKIQEI